jgi:hypothetical protein
VKSDDSILWISLALIAVVIFTRYRTILAAMLFVPGFDQQGYQTTPQSMLNAYAAAGVDPSGYQPGGAFTAVPPAGAPVSAPALAPTPVVRPVVPTTTTGTTIPVAP